MLTECAGDPQWTPLESVTYCGWTWPTQASWDSERGECVYVSSGRRLYYLLVTVALFFLPVAIMLTAYSLIVWRLWITQMPGERSAANINAQCRAKKKVGALCSRRIPLTHMEENLSPFLALVREREPCDSVGIVGS
ncbi:hypothetical protein HPB48_002977 [Haemaphysalis longicornis]|uniref:Uncharacterized protein n=1 Tax=Haemaphysalis longicornis TaxID=44386 RepID=A0A9J6FDX9_HAELO|nr:hypothetical protein HPB48_002977 [Haemaphysalis longicornis]